PARVPGRLWLVVIAATPQDREAALRSMAPAGWAWLERREDYPTSGLLLQPSGGGGATAAARTGAGQPPEGGGPGGMNIALCYESVLPARGGCETYIADLARRLVADGHQVHLYACRWDATALPPALHYHPLSVPSGPRFLRPWRFGRACERALRGADHD